MWRNDAGSAGSTRSSRDPPHTRIRLEGMKPFHYLAALLTLAFLISQVASKKRNPASAPFEIPEARANTLGPSATALPPARTIVAAPISSPIIPLMDSGDFCSVHAEMLKTNFFGSSHVAPVLAHIGASAALQETFAANGPVFGSSTSAKFQSPLARFFYALRKAGLLWAAPPLAADYPTAHAILLELEKADPSNAVFPYFRFELEEAMKLPADIRLKTLEQAAGASRFNLLFTDELRELQARRFENPAYFLVLDNILSNIQGLPRFPSTTEMKKFAQNSSIDAAGLLGRLMMEDGLRATRGGMFYGFYSYQYEEGRYLLGDNEKSIAAWDISLRLEGQNRDDSWTEPRFEEPCNRERYEAAFRDLKSRL